MCAFFLGLFYLCFRSDKESPRIDILKPLLHGPRAIISFQLHMCPVRLLAHVGGSDLCFSADRDGGLELWGVHTGRRASKVSHPQQVGFELKSETHLFDLQRVRIASDVAVESAFNT